jgi:hypothetical protein
LCRQNLLVALEDATVDGDTVVEIANATRRAAVDAARFFGVFDVRVTVSVIRTSTTFIAGTNRSDLKAVLPLNVLTLDALFDVLPAVLSEGFAEATGGSNSSAPLCLVLIAI